MTIKCKNYISPLMSKKLNHAETNIFQSHLSPLTSYSHVPPYISTLSLVILSYFCIAEFKCIMKVVDTRGEKCPKPIIETKKALKETSTGEIFTVLTDSNTSFKNISRFLADNKIKYSVTEKNGIWSFEVINETGNANMAMAENYCENDLPVNSKGNYAIAITSEIMGSGDDALGKKLMKSFFVSLSCLEELPSVIVFYNSGVKLAAKDSEVIDLVKEIEHKGVEIILCGTCVDHFKLGDSIRAGTIGDMYLILEKLSMAGNVIRP
jgi:selenium metabolism protein YedF